MAKKSTVKKTENKAGKKAASRPLVKSVSSKKVTAPIKKAKSVAVKKSTPKAKAKKVIKKAPFKTVKPAPATAKKAPAKKVAPANKTLAKQAKNVKPVKTTISKPQEKSKKSVQVKTTIKSVQSAKPVVKEKQKEKILPKDAAKVKPDADEKFHNKAQRIIKELEETMDMDKVKPRIKVPVYAASRPRHVQQHKLIEPQNTNKEKVQLEFEFRSSKAILFSYLSDSSGMAGWFADEVRSSDDNFVFVWEGSEMHAKQIAIKELQLVRYQWTDENDGTYFQFEIKEDDITSDIALMITDWTLPGEKETNRMLWENQVQQLRQLLGSM